MEALLDGSAACCIAIQAVCNEGYELVCSFGGPGKNALGHGTFTPIGEEVLANSRKLWLVGVLIAGVGPPAFRLRVGPLSPSKPALRGLCRSYALVRRFTSALVRGWS